MAETPPTGVARAVLYIVRIHFSTINQHEFYHDAKGTILKIFGMCMHKRNVQGWPSMNS